VRIRFDTEWSCSPGEESEMSDEQATPETKGVTAEVLASVDLGPEIEGMAGRDCECGW
jgi:hypothetical protein